MKNNSKNDILETPILVPKNTYHQRLQNYIHVRNRIFNENLEIPLQPSVSSICLKRNTVRIRKFFRKKKAKKSRLRKSISAIVSKPNDPRPYLLVDIFGMQLGALLDSGASLSCLSGSAAAKFLSRNIPFKKSISSVEAAGGKKYEILGSFVTDISFNNETKPIELFIIPDLKQDLYLGADFWKSFGLIEKLFSNYPVKEISSISENVNLNISLQKL